MPSEEAWRTQLARSIHSGEELAAYVRLGEREREGIRTAASRYRWHLTPYYAGLMDPDNPSCPIRLQAIPSPEELADPLGVADPIEESARTPAPNLVRLYRDRVAWLVSNVCPVNCRFCFRKRVAQQEGGDWSSAARREALAYIAANPEIRDVLVTGGEPLMLADDELDGILSALRRIGHVEIVRIGTRAPVTLPQRITAALCGMLARHHPLWINVHVNHPRELAPQAVTALARLADAGIPLGNQSVLLAGVNDDAATMLALVQALLRARVRPYYLFQCHLTEGTAHFRTPIETGLAIVAALRAATTGLAVPTYIVDTPRGKVALAPETVVERTDEAVVLRCPDGSLWREHNARAAPGSGVRGRREPYSPTML